MKTKLLGSIACISLLMLSCIDFNANLVRGNTYKNEERVGLFAAGQVRFRFGTDGRVTQSIDSGASFVSPTDYTINTFARTVTITSAGIADATYFISFDGYRLTPSDITSETYGALIKS